MERLTQQRKGGEVVTASARDFSDWKRKHRVSPETKVCAHVCACDGILSSVVNLTCSYLGRVQNAYGLVRPAINSEAVSLETGFCWQHVRIGGENIPLFLFFCVHRNTQNSCV